MAYKFQVGAAILSGSLTQEGTVEIHNDAGAIVGVFDNAGFLSGAAGVEGATFTADGAVTAGSLIVGAANLNATDLLKIDAITNGAGAANKALVLDANATIASGLVALTASSGIKAGEVAATGHLTAPALIATGAGIISGSGQGSFENLRLGGGTSTISNVGVASFGGSVTAVGSFIIGSADLNEADLEKLDGITNGTGAANKALVLDAGSKIGAGLIQLTASAGIKAEKLESSAETVVGSNLTVGALFKMPTVTSGHILVADGTSFEEVAVSGDVTINSAGAVTIANDAVESGMLNDDVISGQTELAANGLAAADELMISDGGTLKKIGIDNLFTDGPGLLTAATVAVNADHFMFLDGGATGDAKTESIVDFVAAIAGGGLGAANGQLSVQGNSVTLATDTVILSEGYNYFTGSATAVCSLPSGSLGDVITVKA